MDNPGTEPSNSPLNTDQAVAVFAEMLEPKVETETEAPETEQSAEAPVETQPEEGAEDQQVEMVEVDIDGYKVQLPKDKAEKLEADRLRQADYTKKTMATADERKAAQAQSQQALQERQQYAQNLHRMQIQLEGALSEQNQSVDWERLAVENPGEYVIQQHLAQKRQAALNQVYGQQQQIQQIHQHEQQQALAQHLQDQREQLLAKVPEWKNQETAKAEQKALAEYLKSQGFDEQSVANIYDAKTVTVARKAMLYDQLTAKASAAAKKVAALPQKVERPGVGQNQALDKRSSAFQKLAKSGRVEDAAAVFAGLL